TRYIPTCGTVVTIPKSVATGSCPTTGVSNCRNKALTLNGPMTIEKTYAGATTCAQFIKTNKSDAVTDQLGTYPVSCTAASPTAEKAPKYGTCPTTDINVVNCRREPELQAAKKYDGVIAAGKTCLDFVNGLSGLPSSTIKTDATPYAVACGAVSNRTSGSTGGSFLFSDSAQYAALNVNKGDACPQVVLDVVTASKGAYTTCSIGDPQLGSQDFSNATCAQTDVAGYCSTSNGFRKNCAGTDTAAGATHETNASTPVYDGTFTCDTKCSDTTFCPMKSGLVKDNYFACATTPQATKVISTFTAQKAPTCLTGDDKVYTCEKYQTTETLEFPVIDKPVTGTDKLSEYIKARSLDLFGDNTPFVSVFARQSGDPLGTNGSLGAAYNRFADSMGGQKFSVLSDAEGYAEALKGLSGMIKERLARSFQVGVMAPDQEIRRVWQRSSGATSWGKPIDASLWSAKGNALTIGKDVPMEYGDEFRIEYW
ncbi:MAG: hypothetical protein AAB250_05305, partial [Bdellovibrionota bacterium]